MFDHKTPFVGCRHGAYYPSSVKSLSKNHGDVEVSAPLKARTGFDAGKGYARKVTGHLVKGDAQHFQLSIQTKPMAQSGPCGSR